MSADDRRDEQTRRDAAGHVGAPRPDYGGETCPDCGRPVADDVTVCDECAEDRDEVKYRYVRDDGSGY